MSGQKWEVGLDSPSGETNDGGSPNLGAPETVRVAHPSLQPGGGTSNESRYNGRGSQGAELRVDRLAAAFPQGRL